MLHRITFLLQARVQDFLKGGGGDSQAPVTPPDPPLLLAGVNRSRIASGYAPVGLYYNIA